MEITYEVNDDLQIICSACYAGCYVHCACGPEAE